MTPAEYDVDEYGIRRGTNSTEEKAHKAPGKAVRLDSAKSTIRASFSRALATAAVAGFSNAAEEGHPLTELQQIDVLTMMVATYYDAVHEACYVLDVEAQLSSQPKGVL